MIKIHRTSFMSWKGEYMQMLLHLNEDFDDDLLLDILGLLYD